MGDETKSVCFKRTAEWQQNRIQIAAVSGIGSDIGQQVQSGSDVRASGCYNHRAGKQRLFARRLDVFSRHTLQTGQRRTRREHLCRQLPRTHFQVTPFGTLIAHGGAGQESPSQYRAERGAETDYRKPRYDSRSGPIECQRADKDKQSRRSGRDPET